MLRNLNVSASGRRICGTPYVGMLGSEIGSASSEGSAGPGYIFPSLSLPADANKRYRGKLGTIPSGLTFTADEYGRFNASATDGTYTVPWTLEEDGVSKGSSTITVTFGALGVTGTFTVVDAGSDAMSAAGYATNLGTLTSTEVGADVFSVAGASVLSGTMASTETGFDTFTASGYTTARGAMAAADIGSDTFAATGFVSNLGTFTSTEIGSDLFGYVTLGSITGTMNASEGSSSSGTGGTGATAEQIADAVWARLITGSKTPGTVIAALQDMAARVSGSL